MRTKTASHANEAKSEPKASQSTERKGAGSKTSSSKSSDAKAMAKDPVCGMNVDKETARHSELDGKTYYFCSEDCQQEFEKNDDNEENAEASEPEGNR